MRYYSGTYLIQLGQLLDGFLSVEESADFNIFLQKKRTSLIVILLVGFDIIGI